MPKRRRALDGGAAKFYLVANMKRLLALFALVLGMAYLAVPAHARMTVSAECSEASGDQHAPAARADRHGEAAAARRQKQRDRQLGKPELSTFRTVILPTVMLVDRPLE